jgi:hypothetical protein
MGVAEGVSAKARGPPAILCRIKRGSLNKLFPRTFKLKVEMKVDKKRMCDKFKSRQCSKKVNSYLTKS